MRVCDNRYQRDRLRFDVAVQFIEREARTQTIRQWTGLSDDRIRKLYHSYVREKGGPSLRRRRGKSPQQATYFLRTTRMRQDASWLASVCALTGMLPLTPATSGMRAAPTVQRAQWLCQTYDAYRALVPMPMLSFEHVISLVSALASHEELVLASCQTCSASMIIDRLSPSVPNCFACNSRRLDECSVVR
jgi:Flagellar transcriptional activator (FlhC)